MLHAITPTSGKLLEPQRFQYKATCAVELVVPSRGATNGGARLLIGGSTFADPMVTVHFGHLAASGKRVDESTIECISPAGTSGPVLVQVSSLQGRCAGGALFIFENVTLLTAHPPQGPETGGTTLIIQGGKFASGLAMSCVFGHGLRSPARSTSASRLECNAPPSAIGIVAVSISSPRGQLMRASSFEYQAAVAVLNAVPSHGDARGGTLVGWSGRADSSVRVAVGGGVWRRQC